MKTTQNEETQNEETQEHDSCCRHFCSRRLFGLSSSSNKTTHSSSLDLKSPRRSCHTFSSGLTSFSAHHLSSLSSFSRVFDTLFPFPVVVEGF